MASPVHFAFNIAGTNVRCLARLREMAIVALLIVFWMSMAGSAAAMSGDVVSLPQLMPGQIPKSGLVLQFDSTWYDGPGYRPIRIHISPQPGTTIAADRTLVIVMQPNAYSRDRGSLSVSQQIEIPAGSQGVDATISVPQFNHWQQLRCDTFEDGRTIEELCGSWNVPLQGAGLQSGYVAPSVLFATDWKPPGQVAPVVATGQPVATTVGPQNPMIVNTFGVSSESSDPRVQWWKTRFGQSSVGEMPINDFPTRWLEYSNLDIVCMSHEQLLQLTTHTPQAWHALRQWVQTGGSLWVYGLNSGEKEGDFKHLDELNRLLEPMRQSDLDPAAGWNTPTPEEIQQAEFAAHESSENLAEFTKINAKDYAGLKSRHLQFGAVVAIGGKEIEDSILRSGSIHDKRMPANWPQVAVASGNSQQVNWIGRHGLSYWAENHDFWNFQIPGVGVPPVGAFLILITLFVIVIGPLNFILLRRWRRQNLTMITVPLCALLMVLLLAGYALMHDGLGTRLRARSFTHLDQAKGQATHHARLSYYAGLTPGGGLKFPADCAAYPLEEEPSFDSFREGHRSIRWSDDAQELTEGWIAARTPMQLYTVQNHKSTAALEIREVAGAPPHIENKLGTDIQLLVLRGSQGDAIYQASELNAGLNATLQATDSASALMRLKALATLQTLAIAPEMLQAINGSSRWGNRTFRYYSKMRYITSEISSGAHAFVTDPASSTSLLENGISTLQGQGDWPLKNRSYVAVVHQMPPDLATGLASPREEASFHVILGTW